MWPYALLIPHVAVSDPSSPQETDGNGLENQTDIKTIEAHLEKSEEN